MRRPGRRGGWVALAGVGVERGRRVDGVRRRDLRAPVDARADPPEHDGRRDGAVSRACGSGVGAAWERLSSPRAGRRRH